MSRPVEWDEFQRVIAEKNRLIEEGQEIIAEQRAELNRLRPVVGAVVAHYEVLDGHGVDTELRAAVVHHLGQDGA